MDWRPVAGLQDDPEDPPELPSFDLKVKPLGVGPILLHRADVERAGCWI